MAGEVPQETHSASPRSVHDSTPPASGPRVILGGGIGAGKSTVAAVFEANGFELIVADDVGRDVLSPGTSAVAEVARRWPDTVVDGVLDRNALAQIVFADQSELDALESITHPEISRRITDVLVAAANRPALIEVPLLSVASQIEAVRVAVVADAPVRIARTIQRGNDEADVRRRLAAQPSDDEWIEWADHVIDNSGAWAETEQLVRAIVDEVMSDG